MDSVTGHLMFVSYLLAVTDEQAIWNRLKKLPPLLLSPLIAILLSLGLSTVTKLGILQYFITTIAILAMCSLWVMRTWRWDFRRAFCAVCMAGILQVATTAISQIFFLMFPSGLQLDMAAMAWELSRRPQRPTASPPPGRRPTRFTSSPEFSRARPPGPPCVW